MDKNAQKKRDRGKNFLEEEKEFLIELVASYKHIVENKKTDGVTSKQKDNAWGCIAQKFNATSKTGIRSAQQLKLLYTTLKKTAKKKRADEKVEVYKTGGGSCEKPVNVTTTCENMIIDLLGPAIQPLENIFDSVEMESIEQDCNPPDLDNDDFIARDNSDNPSNVAYELSPDRPSSSLINQPTSASSKASSIAKEKVTNFFSKVNTLKSAKRKRCEENTEENLNFKRARHEKKMEILEIIKNKELIDLQIKEIELTNKMLGREN